MGHTQGVGHQQFLCNGLLIGFCQFHSYVPALHHHALMLVHTVAHQGHMNRLSGAVDGAVGQYFYSLLGFLAIIAVSPEIVYTFSLAVAVALCIGVDGCRPFIVGLIIIYGFSFLVAAYPHKRRFVFMRFI